MIGETDAFNKSVTHGNSPVHKRVYHPKKLKDKVDVIKKKTGNLV
jgi:hypothetical protein